MKIISPESINAQNIQIKKMVSFEQVWNENNVFSTVGRPRGKSGLMLLTGCSLVCTMDGEMLHAQKGDILYLPPHCEYTSEFFCVTDMPSDRLLDLWLTAEGEELAFSERVIKVGEAAKLSEAEEIFESVHRLFASPTPDLCMAKSQVYRLLAHIGSAQKKGGLKSSRFSMIAKGIRYLEEDPLQEKSIEEIARMCAVSSGCFRRLFAEYAGVSPSVYRIRRKMEKAKLLLESGMVSVCEVAEKLGFSDVSYFSRLFKKYTGYSPKHFVP